MKLVCVTPDFIRANASENSEILQEILVNTVMEATEDDPEVKQKLARLFEWISVKYENIEGYVPASTVRAFNLEGSHTVQKSLYVKSTVEYLKVYNEPSELNQSIGYLAGTTYAEVVEPLENIQENIGRDGWINIRIIGGINTNLEGYVLAEYLSEYHPNRSKVLQNKSQVIRPLNPRKPVEGSQYLQEQQAESQHLKQDISIHPLNARLPVGSSQGTSLIGMDNISQTGELFDFWADLIENEADKVDDLLSTYLQIVKSRKINGLSLEQVKLSTGILSSQRQFYKAQWGVVSTFVYIGTFGTDLYISWRVFVRGAVSWMRVGLWVALCAILVFPSSLSTSFGDGLEFDGERFFPYLIGALIVTGIWIAGYGMVKDSDPFSLLRDKLHELHLDDAVALGLAIHKSVLASADMIGIDSTKLAPRTPFYQQRTKSRI